MSRVIVCRIEPHGCKMGKALDRVVIFIVILVLLIGFALGKGCQ